MKDLKNYGLGSQLKKLRLEKEFSIQDLSNLCGLSISYISLIERNKRDISFKILQNICLHLNISIKIKLIKKRKKK